MRISQNLYRLICVIYIVFYTVVVTQAKAEDIEITEPKSGSATGSPIKLTLKGRTYAKNGWFDQMVDTGDVQPDEKFIIDTVSKYKAGRFKEVKTQWMPDEQDEFANSYNTPEQYANSQSYFRRVTRSKFVIKIFYGHYEIFFVQHEVKGYGSNTIPYVINIAKGKFYFTNKLANDPTFNYLFAKYANLLNKKH